MGRPKKSEGDRGTRHVRVYDDLAEMIRWITRIEGTNSAQLLDPLVRPSVVARYKTIEADADRIRRAEEAAKAKHRKPPAG